MFKKVMILGAVAVSALAITSTAVAGGGNSESAKSAAACVQAGIGTLVSLGLIDEAARGEIDYSTLADPTNGPIFTTLPSGSFIPLKDVVSLHRTNPELFAWCT